MSVTSSSCSRRMPSLLPCSPTTNHLPPHLPPTHAPPGLQLHSVDLSGATACCDADLLPLSQLSQLTSLSLAGLWRITVSSCWSCF